MLDTSPILLILLAAFSAQPPPVYVGILEPPLEPGAAFRIRVVFRFQGGHWSAMPHEAPDLESLEAISRLYPRQLAWTIVFDGKTLGTLKGVAPENWSRYADLGIEDLTADSKPPAIRSGAAAFRTWTGAPVFRPLVVISQPNLWKPARRSGKSHRVGRGMKLLDTGDYDGDGTPESIFQSSGYNHDGYLLLHAADGSTYEFSWSYH